MIYHTLYHLDNNDNLRVWCMEREGSQYRTYSGVAGGKITISDWKQANAKNVGKANATSDEEQAEAEIKALYQKKLERKYSETAETATKCHYVQPMLADKFNEKKTLKTPKKWYGQPKFDGLRCVIDPNGGTSRAGKPFYTVEHIVDRLYASAVNYNITLDGELYNHDYREDFEKIVSLVKKQKIESLTQEERDEIVAKVQFHIYDIIMWDDLDATYEERLALIEHIFTHELDVLDKTIQLAETVELDSPTLEQINELHDDAFARGYEGYMLRDASSKYEFKRSKGLLKYKNFDEAEFPVLEIIEGQGNWSGAAKSVVVLLPDGGTSDAGVAGTYERNVQVLKNAKKYVNATIKYQGYTKDGKLRFGVVKDFHEGERDY